MTHWDWDAKNVRPAGLEVRLREFVYSLSTVSEAATDAGKTRSGLRFASGLS